LSPHSFTSRIAARIAALVKEACPGVLEPGLLVGLSGGPDSVALLLAARHWSKTSGCALSCAHLNHEMRGEHADGDADYCRDLCAELEVPLYVESADPRPLARERGAGVEEAGRHLRRSFFTRLLREHPELNCVATGHHRDDQIETVVMRLFRGTGPEGLRGIRPVHGEFIHPLLEVDRREIVGYLEDCNRPWRTDASNLTGDNIRARVRRELLPVAANIFGPASSAIPARLAGLLDTDLDLLDELTVGALADLSTNGQDASLSVAGLLALRPALTRRVLRHWLIGTALMPPERLEMIHVENILAWLREGQSGTGLDLPGGLRLQRDFDQLRCTGPRAENIPLRSATEFRILVERSDSVIGPETIAGEAGGGLNTDGSWELSCPACVLEGNLKIRNWRQGDRFQPFGLDGTKLLSDLLREHKIPAEQRSDVLVVEDGAGILWVVGVARDERTRLLPTTDHAVTLTVARRDTDSRNQGKDTR